MPDTQTLKRWTATIPRRHFNDCSIVARIDRPFHDGHIDAVELVFYAYGSEREARAYLRTQLGLRRLPVGITIRMVSDLGVTRAKGEQA